VIGFDDLPDAAHLIPPLSTIRPDFTETGRRCITILLDQMQTGRPPRLMRSIVPVDLIIRRSVATAPRA
jgi:DNA-binding LacI/PurR family transcriptional regulator